MNIFIATSVFFETMYLDRFVLVKKFMYFMPKSKDTLSRRSEMLKIRRNR
jgi:hypothetical protein